MTREMLTELGSMKIENQTTVGKVVAELKKKWQILKETRVKPR